MADFKFNFVISEDEDESANDEMDGKAKQIFDADTNDSEATACEVHWIPTADIQNMKKVQHTFGNHTLFTIAAANVEDYLLQEKEGTCAVVQAIIGHSDLVPGRYEGGLKVWECSIDLCHYLLEYGPLAVAGNRVLELGCGAGLPGILAGKLGASSVHFQDFNKEVLERYTMVNLSLNNLEHSSCAFFAGDWNSFASLADNNSERYDLILTSETIYNISSYAKLLRVFSLLLAEAGIILVAAKNEYFGVGGSIYVFSQYVQASGQFSVEVVKHIDTGVPCKILKLMKCL